MKGRILRSTGSWYDILGDDENIYKGRLRGRFKLKGLKVTNPIAVGDRVTFEAEDTDTVNITDILQRDNYIIRKSTHKTGHAHLIAANIDQAVLVVTLFYPRTSLGFIDRFLVSAEAFRIPAVIVFNKTDIYKEEDREVMEDVSDMYREIGYKVIPSSTITGEGMEEVKKQLTGKYTLLSGHSGVGKSTLLNKLYNFNLRTAQISDFAEKGKHTTTFAEMLRIDQDTFIIDTPGIKELGIIDMERSEISHYFREMRELLGMCKFNNCLHVNEPGCAVKDAVQEGKITLNRYDNYLSMLNEEDQHR